MSIMVANALITILGFILGFLKLLIIASIIISWVGDRNNQIVQMIFQLSEPIYAPIRKFTSKIPGPLDFAPIVAFVMIEVVNNTVVDYLRRYVAESSSF